MKPDETFICIIDDDKIYQSLTKKMLLKLNENAKVIQFSNGQEAYEFFANEIRNNCPLPKVILLDINMPTMDGWEFLEEIENLGTDFHEMEIYIVSSSIAIQDMEKAKSNPHIMDYITKPIRQELLIQLVS